MSPLYSLVGGLAIFIMHFVGMGSLVLHTDEGLKVSFSFDIGLTVLSLLSSVSFVYLGLFISSRDRAYVRTKPQIAELTCQDASAMTIEQIRSTNFVALALFKDVLPLLAGGVVTGSGIIVMHYIGMMAIVFPGRIVNDTGFVAGSITIAIVASSTAFWILFRFLALYPNQEWPRLGGAIVMAAAVCCTHYTGAAGATFDYDPDCVMVKGIFSAIVKADVAVPITLTVGMVYPFFMLFIMLADIRYSFNSRVDKIERIDILFKKYQEQTISKHGKTFDLDDFINKYDLIFARRQEGNTQLVDSNCNSRKIKTKPCGGVRLSVSNLFLKFGRVGTGAGSPKYLLGSGSGGGTRKGTGSSVSHSQCNPVERAVSATNVLTNTTANNNDKC